jgi:hypothetical protein
MSIMVIFLYENVYCDISFCFDEETMVMAEYRNSESYAA